MCGVGIKRKGFIGLIVILSVLVLIYFFSLIQSDESVKNPTSNDKPTSSQNIKSDATDTSYRKVPGGNSYVDKGSADKKVAAVNNADSQFPTFQTEDGSTYPIRTYKTLAINDPSGYQWWTNNTGLDTVWDIAPGPQQTSVAIIDTGFSLKHEEFINRWLINNDENGSTAIQAASKLNCSARLLPINKSCNLIDDNFDGIVDNETGLVSTENPSQLNCSDRGIAVDKSCNLIDDDNNGYIDDVKGWDFANYDPSVQAGEINQNGTGTQHGTEVSGVLAATGNNSKGIAGVDWSTKILPIQAISDDSYGNTLTVSRAVRYAADRGVDIISLSLGSDQEDTYLRQSIQYAIDKGSLVVAASGNDGCDCMIYPAQYPEVFSVGSYDTYNNASNFSSFGNSLDVLAPGENITTTTWTKSQPTNSYINGVSGTSFAAPYISGLLSLSRSYQPNSSWGELTNNLLATANHASLTINNPWDARIGSGYVRANSFISRVTNPTTPLLSYRFSPIPQTGILDSKLAYQCYLPGDFPTAPFYEINKATSTYYTIDTLDYIRATSKGYGTRSIGRTCVGLNNDAPSTIRIINLLSEIKNIQPPKA